MTYTNEQAIAAIQARISGVYDDPELIKLGSLSPNPLSDIKVIVKSIDREQPSPIIQKLFLDMDWKLLRKQKQALFNAAVDKSKISPVLADTCEGMLNLLDAIMDLAVDELKIPSVEVFGKKY